MKSQSTPKAGARPTIPRASADLRVGLGASFAETLRTARLASAPAGTVTAPLHGLRERPRSPPDAPADGGQAGPGPTPIVARHVDPRVAATSIPATPAIDPALLERVAVSLHVGVMRGRADARLVVRVGSSEVVARLSTDGGTARLELAGEEAPRLAARIGVLAEESGVAFDSIELAP